MVMNDKIMFDGYYYINSANLCKCKEIVGRLYLIPQHIYLCMHVLINMLDLAFALCGA